MALLVWVVPSSAQCICSSMGRGMLPFPSSVLVCRLFRLLVFHPLHLHWTSNYLKYYQQDLDCSSVWSPRPWGEKILPPSWTTNPRLGCWFGIDWYTYLMQASGDYQRWVKAFGFPPTSGPLSCITYTLLITRPWRVQRNAIVFWTCWWVLCHRLLGCSQCCATIVWTWQCQSHKWSCTAVDFHLDPVSTL